MKKCLFKPFIFLLCFLFFTAIMSGCQKNINKESKELSPRAQVSKKQNSEYKNNAGPLPAKKALHNYSEAVPRAQKQLSSQIIGSYWTKIYDTEKNRINNILVSSKAIDGTIIMPGKTFSFNGLVGLRTGRKGYKTAAIILYNKRDYAVGGGICQVSSTLYNAAVNAGMNIIERHSHTKKVPYIQKGLDATVNYGAQDLKFKNIKNYPIKINISVSMGKVNASISKTH